MNLMMAIDQEPPRFVGQFGQRRPVVAGARPWPELRSGRTEKALRPWMPAAPYMAALACAMGEKWLEAEQYADMAVALSDVRARSSSSVSQTDTGLPAGTAACASEGAVCAAALEARSAARSQAGLLCGRAAVAAGRSPLAVRRPFLTSKQAAAQKI